MTIAALKKRLSRLEKGKCRGRNIFLSSQFERYEDYLVEAKKARNDFPNTISSINVIPPASELKECLQRMETAKMDEELIDFVKKELASYPKIACYKR
ncbi:hypothetical protein [Methanolobus halotolerans]|uniref:Uncharacterized protein n=1 Tax=Methanolobus halotolerans TaxID=2052935 RepID=A0A4E0QQ58_9EURY|nr:hypothetical protein [Methanolobus halotolerans]TGC07016.1 hypothetical protein CUN85_12030 [Methanolobus halotolerans]